MPKRLALLIAVVSLVITANLFSNEQTPSKASVERLEADVRFLSNDLLEGREAGTRGYDLAALYVAQRFRSIGLKPGGDDSTYYQSVPMLEYAPGAENASLRIDGVDLVAGEDYLVFPSSKGESIDIRAPLIFGGMCFASAREGRDDFLDLDFEGKIAACMWGAPKYLNSEERAHYRSTQGQRVSDHGGIGGIFVYTSSFQQVLPFERLKRMLGSSYSRMTWLESDGTPFSSSPNLKVGAVLSLAGAQKFFESTGRSWDKILMDAESNRGEVDRFDLGVEVNVSVESQHRKLTSNNVIGILPGTDEELAKEHVILTAHLDHVGIKPTEEADDDEIYNGAMDNASGISALLEVARLLKASPPKRSVVFIALTAEEKGLNGSDYFARNPTLPGDDMVAVINLDMPILTYSFTDINAFGAERSSLFEPVKAAAEAHGLTLSPDPVPEEGLFTRSDHYMFVRQGVPAVYLKPGFADGGQEAQEKFRKTHYHEASDEVGLVDFSALERFTDVKADIARNIANMPERPVWNAGDFFGTTFEGPMAKE
jgi:hypothetical protein